VDSDTFSGSILIRALNPGNAARIGMSASIDIVTEKTEAFVVPRNAVLVDLEGSYVFVNRDNTAMRIPVTPGYAKGNLMEISGGIASGDVLVTDGSFKLFDGAKLNVVVSGESDGTGRANGRSSEASPGGKKD